jgi:hypothetical protein
MRGISHGESHISLPEFGSDRFKQDGEKTKTACEERWKNLSEDIMKKMWGIYDETGVFICLCRHGFVWLVADMITV